MTAKIYVQPIRVCVCVTTASIIEHNFKNQYNSIASNQ